MQTMQVPQFGVGQIDGVETYVTGAIAEFCIRSGIDSQIGRLTELAVESLRAAAPLMRTSLMAGSVLPVPAVRRFWLAVGDVLVSRESTLEGEEHLRTAMRYLDSGGNVVIIQNHRSGSDNLVMEMLVNRFFGNRDIAANWSYMAGHAVNLYLIPLMFTAALHRFQIFSAKYHSLGLPGIATERDINAQNLRALTALRRHATQGSQVVVYYPEGGRGDNGMKLGEPKTVCIPTLLSGKGMPPLLVLPTYVHDTVRILPPVRGQNEFNEVFAHAQHGTARITFGQPVKWEALQPSLVQLEAAQARLVDPDMRRIGTLAYQRHACDAMLSLVAGLGPVAERGPYADDAFVESLIGHLMEVA